jgi:hypothetical protein
MKTIIKIVVALFILTACFNASRAALNNYTFEDAVHEGLLFDQRATDAQIVTMVMKLANDYGIPMDPKDIAVRQVGQDVIVDMSYTTNVVLVPGILQRDWTFNPSTSTKMLVGGRRSQ